MNWEVIKFEEFKTLSESICSDSDAKYSLLYGLSLDVSDSESDHLFLKFGQVVIALQTSSNSPLVISDLNEQAAKKLASFIEKMPRIKEIVGSSASVTLVLDNLRHSHPGFPEMIMSQKIYKNEKVIMPEVKHKIIQASEVHLDLVSTWIKDFLIDTFINLSPNPKKMKNLAQKRIDNGEVWLLIKDGVPVSMACKARPTKRSITINGVFTPIERRGEGFASECTALLTQKMLETFDFCTLYTDATNETSNKIYTDIGYEFECDSLHYKLSD